MSFPQGPKALNTTRGPEEEAPGFSRSGLDPALPPRGQAPLLLLLPPPLSKAFASHRSPPPVGSQELRLHCWQPLIPVQTGLRLIHKPLLPSSSVTGQVHRASRRRSSQGRWWLFLPDSEAHHCPSCSHSESFKNTEESERTLQNKVVTKPCPLSLGLGSFCSPTPPPPGASASSLPCLTHPPRPWS